MGRSTRYFPAVLKTILKSSLAIALSAASWSSVHAEVPEPHVPPLDPAQLPAPPLPAPTPATAPSTTPAPATAPSPAPAPATAPSTSAVPALDAALPPPLPPPDRWALEVGGYGDIRFSWHDYGTNQNLTHGAQKDSRLVFDTTRFALKLKASMPWDLHFEAELEVEHHGSGGALELEHEEFGEFEQDLELGGEVNLEELYLRKNFGPFGIKVGRFYLGVGLMSEINRPTRYLATARPEAETMILPAVWHELGVQFDLKLKPVKITAQIVNGLDSTGFSSQRWIGGGHQLRTELVSASDLAFILRADVTPTPGVSLGVSAYYGGTSRNRPKADLVPDCPPNDREVAACGYVQASVTLIDFHFKIDLAPFSAQGVVLWGHLDNALAVTDRNRRLSNALGAPRSPVASEAFFTWFELGYDLGALLGLPAHHRLTPFVRFDYYDAMFTVDAAIADNPRFARAVTTAGIGWFYADSVFAKLDVALRDLAPFEPSPLRDETSINLATGFSF